MKLFPAIDIINHQAVRLTQGDYDRMNVYHDSPLAVAKSFEATGATCLHVVDLDGAKDGSLANFDTIREIVENTSLFVEVGGGIRDEERIKAYLAIGVSRVILGTVAVKNPAFVADMVKKYGEKIAVGVDAKDGMVATHGWLTVSHLSSVDFCYDMQAIGVKTIIYTDIAKDGAMSGTNLPIYRELSAIPDMQIVASGGITYYSELEELDSMGIYGAILGKALYTGTLDLATALATVKEEK